MGEMLILSSERLCDDEVALTQASCLPFPVWIGIFPELVQRLWPHIR